MNTKILQIVVILVITLAVLSWIRSDAHTTQGAEGGAFHQDELRSRSGGTLRRAVDQLRGDFASVIPLFEAVINSRRCSECPAPDDWLQLFDRICCSKPCAPYLSRSVRRRRRGCAPFAVFRVLETAAATWATVIAPKSNDRARV